VIERFCVQQIFDRRGREPQLGCRDVVAQRPARSVEGPRGYACLGIDGVFSGRGPHAGGLRRIGPDAGDKDDPRHVSLSVAPVVPRTEQDQQRECTRGREQQQLDDKSGWFTGRKPAHNCPAIHQVEH
jgi:hypothetical protein